MIRSARLLAGALVTGMAASPAGATPSGIATYRPELADQFQVARLEDNIPADPAARLAWARALAFGATIYGTPAVLIYRQMFDQVFAPGPAATGFSVFAHGRSLAGPGYRPFKTPNADTLYSNAYLDLRRAPVRFEVPDTAGRYFTANFLDMFGNATNISARTRGTGAGRYLIAPVGWEGTVPEGFTVFRVPGRFAWILLRVLADGPADTRIANGLQDRFRLIPMQDGLPEAVPDGHDDSAAGFLRALDFVLRGNGIPEGEAGLVARFRGIGIGGERSVDAALADPQVRAGVEAGYAEARQVIRAGMGQNGRKRDHWSEPKDVGRYGYDYLYRASINTLGTGGNVPDENFPFTTFEDEQGQPLDGARGDYQLHLQAPPPARYFWSVTVYDGRTFQLHQNPAGKYQAGNRTRGLRIECDGSLILRFTAGSTASRPGSNTLPIPRGPFYVVIRSQGPEQALLRGEWRPAPIRLMTGAGK
ncbi:MAG: DUF1254 domain-containing protein [Sphingomonadales bacterium]|nr:DUF1254 domain-containing protein [Sphingomonadales bacterium]